MPDSSKCLPAPVNKIITGNGLAAGYHKIYGYFYSVVGLDKIPYAAYENTFSTWKHPVLHIFTTESLNIIRFCSA